MNDTIPADILVLTTSNSTGICHIETSNLDGETNLKQREIVSLSIDGEISPLTMLPEKPIPIHKNNMLLRGCVLRNTDYVIGIVIYAGSETKAALNNSGVRFKRSKLERQINMDIIWCVLILVGVCFSSAVWHQNLPGDDVLFVTLDRNSSTSSPAYQGFLNFWRFVIIFQTIIPLPLYVTIEFVKMHQVWHMNNDLQLYDSKLDRRIEIRAFNIPEDLGQIEYVFTDKTGTLTENKMKFQRASINGNDYYTNNNENRTVFSCHQKTIHNEFHSTDVNSKKISSSEKMNNKSIQQSNAIPSTITHVHQKLFKTKQQQPQQQQQQQQSQSKPQKHKRLDQSMLTRNKQTTSTSSLLSNVLQLNRSNEMNTQIEQNSNNLNRLRNDYIDNNEDYNTTLNENISQETLIVDDNNSKLNDLDIQSINTDDDDDDDDDDNHHDNESIQTINCNNKKLLKINVLIIEALNLDISINNSQHILNVSHIDEQITTDYMRSPRQQQEQQQQSHQQPHQHHHSNIHFSQRSLSTEDINLQNSSRYMQQSDFESLDSTDYHYESNQGITIMNNNDNNNLQLNLNELKKPIDNDIDVNTTRTLTVRIHNGSTFELPIESDRYVSISSELKQCPLSDKTLFNSYESESPDELCLVKEACKQGYKLLQRGVDFTLLWLPKDGLVCIHVLRILPFDSQRKRMSILFRHPYTNEPILFTKGADTSIMNRLDKSELNSCELVTTTQEHIDHYSRMSLRTLVIAERLLTEDELHEWLKEVYEMETGNDYSEEAMMILMDKLERNFILLGATGIEDRLQEGVPETIEVLREAGMHVWMLTGDKQETAVNIARSANLITSQHRIMYLNAHSENRIKFIQLCEMCTNAAVVSLVKNELNVHTLAIGDGANDVNMIQVANVGIGINSGEEGMQAVMASDFAISQFRYLKQLLLVHGHCCYDKLAHTSLYLFYKDAIYIFLLFWFQMFNGFSGSNAIDQFSQILFSVTITGLPPFIMGIWDNPLDDKTLLANPILYRAGINVFFLSYFAYADDTIGLWEFGLFQTNAITLCTLLHSLLIISYVLAYLMFTMIYHAVAVTAVPPECPYRIIFHTMNNAKFWLLTLITIILALLPRNNITILPTMNQLTSYTSDVNLNKSFNESTIDKSLVHNHQLHNHASIHSNNQSNLITITDTSFHLISHLAQILNLTNDYHNKSLKHRQQRTQQQQQQQQQYSTYPSARTSSKHRSSLHHDRHSPFKLDPSSYHSN
ncbi:putative phospholipid-transporting ATPase VD [Schistosoma japonicum]|nr:putative phospholipid-transporting ATPase VD [Schistosoma japonicum]